MQHAALLSAARLGPLGLRTPRPLDLPCVHPPVVRAVHQVAVGSRRAVGRHRERDGYLAQLLSPNSQRRRGFGQAPVELLGHITFCSDGRHQRGYAAGTEHPRGGSERCSSFLSWAFVCLAARRPLWRLSFFSVPQCSFCGRGRRPPNPSTRAPYGPFCGSFSPTRRRAVSGTLLPSTARPHSGPLSKGLSRQQRPFPSFFFTASWRYGRG